MLAVSACLLADADEGCVGEVRHGFDHEQQGGEGGSRARVEEPQRRQREDSPRHM